MASYNRVILIGNVTRDIDLRYTPTGVSVAKIGLAVNDKRKSNTGEWVEETCFVDVTAFGKTAEVARDYLTKGSPVFIEGKLRYETWEKEGIKHFKLSVVCDRLQLMGSKRDANSHTGGYSESIESASDSSNGYSSADEDVPF